MIYLTLGQGIRHGIPLYSGIYDNKPPFLYIIAAVAGNLFWFKVILALINIISIFLFWKLTEILFPKKQSLQKISTITFGLLTTLPFLEGNIVNAELFMITPIIGSLIIIFSKKHNSKNIVLAGMLFSLAVLFKIPAAFDLPVIIIFWIICTIDKKDNFKKSVKKSFFLAIGFIIPILITFLWFYFQGSLKEYLQAAFLQNIGYLSSWRPSDNQKPFLIRNLPLLIRALVVFFSSLILFLKRNRLSKKFIFITIWLLFSLFGATLSERPYPHYLIQAVPPISLLLGILFTQENLEQSLAVIPLTLAFSIPVVFNYYHYPTFSYYLRFIKFSLGEIPQREYLLSFDRNVIRNYDISNFLASSMGENDRVFVVGDSAVIYALSKKLPPIKFVADYHINDFSDMQTEIENIEKSLPKFIVILPQKQNLTSVIPLVRQNYILVSEIDGAEIWKISSVTK